MTTTWLIVNIALIAAVTAIVALPAVLIPLLLGREPARVGVTAARAAAPAATRRAALPQAS